MSDKSQEPAWSEESDAVYVAVVSMIDEVKAYGERANLVLNLLRYITMTEAADSLDRVIKEGGVVHVFVDSKILLTGMQYLVDDFAEEAKKMPKRVHDVMQSDHGCGTCARCKAAAKAAYSDNVVMHRPSKESRDAITAIINTITGKPKNPDN